MKNIIKLLKPNHYIKNLVVIVPLIFSMNLFNYSLWINVLYAFISFCAISSCIYVINDLIDVEKDRLHPIKSLRPIAANLISKKFAVVLMISLLILSLYFAWLLNWLSVFCVLAYVFINILYSYVLKNIEIIDAFCIALGFILRMLMGCFAISVIPSPLIILMTFFISMFFTFSKRKMEKILVKDENLVRDSIKGMDLKTIEQFVVINAVLSIAFYFTYTLDKTTILRAGTNYLYVTVIPFALLIYRLLYLSNLSIKVDDPMHFIEKDTTIKWLSLFYFVLFLLVMTVLK